MFEDADRFWWRETRPVPAPLLLPLVGMGMLAAALLVPCDGTVVLTMLVVRSAWAERMGRRDDGRFASVAAMGKKRA